MEIIYLASLSAALQAADGDHGDLPGPGASLLWGLPQTTASVHA